MVKKSIILLILAVIFLESFAQQNEIHYNIANTSELQYSIFDKDERNPKFVNLLQLESTLSTDGWWKGGSFEASFWSVIESFRHNIANDEMPFSNIEERNRWLVCSKLGYQHTIGNLSLFAGIRNVDIDYFSSPYSFFFTNSPAGIFPTISMNCAVATYPLGAMGVHVEYKRKKLNIKNSFYNHLNNINGRVVFKFNFDPKRYGYVNFSQIQYTSSKGIYAAGLVLDKLPQSSMKYSVYALAEQSVTEVGKHKIGVIGQLGYAPKKNNHCSAYYGAGIVVSDLFQDEGKDNLGLIAYRANTNHRSETAVELTYKCTVCTCFSIQPALHYIGNSDTKALVGLVRGVFTFGN